MAENLTPKKYIDSNNMKQILTAVKNDIPTTVAELTDSSSYAKTTDIPTTLPANGGNSDTVNNHTVKSDVPENAVFTDTVYDDTELNAKLGELSKLKTTEKTNLVGAINEVAESCGNVVISSQILTPLFSEQSGNKVVLYKMGKLRMISPINIYPSSPPVMTYFDAYQLPEDSYPPRKMWCLMNTAESIPVDFAIEESGKIQMRYRGDANYVWISSVVWVVN